MSIFKYELAEGEVDPLPEAIRSQFIIIDSVGEAIHIHLRNLRIDLSIDEFETFAHNVEQAQQRIDEPFDEGILITFGLSSGGICRIERNSEGVFHVRVDRARIELSTQELRCFTRVIEEAGQSLRRTKQEEGQHSSHRAK